MTRIYIASDHAGFELKKQLIPYIKVELNLDVIDEGPYEYKEGDDYPDYVNAIPKKILEEGDALGIIIGHTGQGEAISVNRYKGVRTTVFYGGNMEILSLGREHNDANILSLGAGFLTLEEANEAVKIWLGSAFSNDERHVRRLRKIEQSH
jgi:ribose 5-phosphate isomerase B